MSAYENPNQTATHETSVKAGWADDFVCKCSCGWSSDSDFSVYSTTVAASGAGDRHLARVMSRKA